MAVRTQHTALVNFDEQICPAAERGYEGYFAKLVSQVIEVEDHWIVLSASFTRMLAQVGI
jgi:hypothetical protein